MNVFGRAVEAQGKKKERTPYSHVMLSLATWPWIHVRAGTLIKDRLPFLMHADNGLRIDRTLLQYSGASCIQVREVRRVPMCHSEGCLALECMLAYSLLPLVGLITGDPGVFSGNPYPYPCLRVRVCDSMCSDLQTFNMIQMMEYYQHGHNK
jgi:hypothetical protein